ncbi:MAG: transposase, partial [Opitutaceae bacterium]
MFDNSFLPGFGDLAGPLRFGKFLQAAKACTLSKIEERLGGFLPAGLLAEPFPTERPYSGRRTFWCLVFQMLSGNASCDEVVRQLQAMLSLVSPEHKPLCAGNSAYCQARARLPELLLEQAIEQGARSASQLAAAPGILPGKRLLLVDGTTVALPDTPENQAEFPQPRFQKKGCGFPLMRVLALCLLKGGAVLKTAVGNYRKHELRLMQEFMAVLGLGDVVVYDRIAGNYAAAARIKEQGADLISRVARRRIDFRKGKRLGKDDALFEWPKGAVKSPYLSQEEWDRLPAILQ